MSADAVWAALVGFALGYLIMKHMILADRVGRLSKRLAESRIDTFNLVEALVEHNDPQLKPYDFETLDVRLRREFPHLYDLDQRAHDIREAERAS